MEVSELFLFSADNKDGLLKTIKETIKISESLLDEEFGGFAKFNNEHVNFSKKFKAALVAKNSENLQFLLKELLTKIEAGDFKEEKLEQISDFPIYFSSSSKKYRLAFLFPPQGTQKLNAAQILIQKFSWAKEIADKIDQDTLERLHCDSEDEEIIKNKTAELTKSENAQISVVLSSLLWLEFLKKLGIKPDVAAGHSLGELVALYEAGAFDIDSLIANTTLRGQALGNTKIIGTMLGLFCSEARAKKITDNIKDVQIASVNALDQVVVSGTKEAITKVEKKAKDFAVNTYSLPVGNAFHSKLMSGAANYFSENFKANKKFTPSKPLLFSSVTGKKIEDEINLKEYLSKQITSPARFIDMIEQIDKEVDFAIEIGAGNILTKLVEKITDKMPCFNSETTIGSFYDFNITLANLFVRNFEINIEELYKSFSTLEFIAPLDNKVILSEVEKIIEIKNEEIVVEKLEEKITTEVSEENSNDIVEPLIEEKTVDTKVDFIENLEKFAKENTLELPIIDADYEKKFIVEPIHYRTDYQWSGLLNGYNNKFFELVEIIEKNTAGTMILVIEETVNKTQLFNNHEKLQIDLLNNDQNNFLFKIRDTKDQILIVTTFLGVDDNKKVIAIIVNEKPIKNEIQIEESEAIKDAKEEINLPLSEPYSQEKIIDSNEDIEETIKPEEISQNKTLIHTTYFNTLFDDLTSYHKWHSDAFKEFIYKTNPEFLQNPTQKFLCLESNLRYLSDLEPFEKIEAKLYIENLKETSFELSCDFYSTKTDKKLAEGNQKITFVEKNGTECEVPKWLR